ncbi:MAG: CPBP family intramembrane metalloprotease, partial [Anaerolineae bacterium]|nr:CPBP family intramembrane metalloprotease [Anaerolineae bacterium]
PVLIAGTPITLAFLLISTVVMWSPALAHILTRIITHEGWQIKQLQPRFKRTWPYWLTAWFLPGILTLGGLALFLLIFPGYFDSSLSTLRTLIETSAPDMDLSGNTLWLIIAAQTVQAMVMAPLVNSFATFGEEFGWRAYLQPKLMPLGGRRAMLLLGVIWGVWHWPIILMGHNYGLDYPGAPVLGPLAMVWFTIVFGIFLGWLTIKSGNVWPAVIGHAAINGIAGLGGLFVHGEPNPLLGPLPTGIIGGVGFTLVALLIFFSPGGLSKPQPPQKIKKTAATKAVTPN